MVREKLHKYLEFGNLIFCESCFPTLKKGRERVNSINNPTATTQIRNLFIMTAWLAYKAPEVVKTAFPGTTSPKSSEIYFGEEIPTSVE